MPQTRHSSTPPPQRIIYQISKRSGGDIDRKIAGAATMRTKGNPSYRETTRGRTLNLEDRVVETSNSPMSTRSFKPVFLSPFFFFLDDGVRMVRTMMCEKGRNNRFICFRWDAVSTSLCVCLIFNRMEWANEGENKN